MAAWMVAMLSFSSAAPYMPDMPMQPRPMAETSGPFFPNRRICIGIARLVARHEQMKFGRQRNHVNCDIDACWFFACESSLDSRAQVLYLAYALGVASKRRGNLMILGVAKLCARQPVFSGDNFLKVLGGRPTVVVHHRHDDGQLVAHHG